MKLELEGLKVSGMSASDSAVADQAWETVV